ncbi:MAG: hypothetical protein QOF76_4482 [Solirubrobacteraceae bacterium]|jgi:pyruvate/2-oxoglutarate dehydrogenase complex dihydrolipoamide acyltransferase (E2) component|nr:hypothetical protein [Solirubrobacteraceae bacterium]
MPHLVATAVLGVSTPPTHGALLSAVAVALREVPEVNGAYTDGGASAYADVNLAVALPGPVAPVIADADERTPAELEAALAELRGRAAETFVAADLAGATFTVHGLGVDGLASLTPVLTPRQAGALGVAGAHLTLALDARLLGADDAGRFLRALVAAVE